MAYRHWMSAAAVVAALSLGNAARANDLSCTQPKETLTPVKIGQKDFQKISTPVDGDVKSDCSDVWSNPLDHWLYGEFYPLFSQKIFETDKERIAHAATRSQPSMTRAVCTESKNTAGYYAYEYRPREIKGGTDASGIVRGTMDLHFLCVPEAKRGGGLGVDLMNAAVIQASRNVLKDQKITVRLVALPQAQRFYDRLLLNCTEESDGVQDRQVYSATLTNGETINRKTAVWTEACDRVIFGCISVDDYTNAVANGYIVDKQACAQKETPTEVHFNQIAGSN